MYSDRSSVVVKIWLSDIWRFSNYSRVFSDGPMCLVIKSESGRKISSDSIRFIASGTIFKGSPDPNHFIFEITERVGFDIERLWIWMRYLQSILRRSRNSSFNFRVILIGTDPFRHWKIKWLGSALPLKIYRKYRGGLVNIIVCQSSNCQTDSLRMEFQVSK